MEVWIGMYLIVDDDEGVIKALKRVRRDRRDVFCILCDDVDAVEEAVGLVNPRVLLFDHSIRDGNREGGFIIARVFSNRGMKLYSISGDASTAGHYKDLGVEWLGKDMDKIDEVLSAVYA